MTPIEPPEDLMIIKWAGGFLGGILSLIYLPPTSIRELLGRIAFSSIVGGTLSFIVSDYFHWDHSSERTLGAAIIAGGFAWVVTGAVSKIIKNWHKPTK